VLAVLAGLGGRVAAHDEEKDAPAQAAVQFVVAGALVQEAWTDEQLDQWVFQNDHNAASARRRLESSLTLHVDAVDTACKLTDEQKTKLQLAGRGDIKRFFDRYEAIKLKWQNRKRDNDNINNVFQDIQPLQITLQTGIFGDSSIFHKSLPHTLNGEQQTRYDAVLRERGAFRHRANIELVVTMVEQGVPLRDAQRRAIIELLTKETKPLRKSSQYDYYVLLFQLGQFPEEKLKKHFDDAQWKVLKRLVEQYRGLEQFLKQNGIWPDEEATPSK
jgi:hypothetical protein